MNVNETGGLLGFLKSPEGQGLLSAAFGGMAGAQRGTPWNNVGRGGIAGVMGYGNALERDAQIAQMKQAGELRGMQTQQTQLQLEQLRREAEKQRFMEDQAKNFYRPATPGTGANMPAIEAGLPPEMRTGLPAMNGAPAKPASFDMPGYMGSISSKYPLDAMKMQQAAAAANEVKLGPEESIIDRTTGKPKFAGTGKLTDDQREYNFAVGNGYKGSLQDWIIAQKKAGATNVNVSTEKSLFGKVAGEIGQQIGDSRVAAQGAVKTIDTVNRLRDALDSGKVMAGPGASFMQFGAQVGNVLGVGGKDNTERLTNTRQAIQSLAQLELGAAAQMKGQGQITEAERAILKRAESGDFDKMTIPELRLLADTMDKLARKRIDMHNSQIDPLSQNPEAKALAPYLRVTPPEGYKPRGSVMRQPQQPAASGGIQFLGFENN